MKGQLVRGWAGRSLCSILKLASLIFFLARLHFTPPLSSAPKSPMSSDWCAESLLLPHRKICPTPWLLFASFTSHSCAPPSSPSGHPSTFRGYNRHFSWLPEVGRWANMFKSRASHYLEARSQEHVGCCS